MASVGAGGYLTRAGEIHPDALGYINYDYPQETQIRCMNIYHTLILVQQLNSEDFKKVILTLLNKEFQILLKEMRHHEQNNVNNIQFENQTDDLLV